MILKISIYLIFLTALLAINGCKDNSVNNNQTSLNMSLVGTYDTPGNATGISVYQSSSNTTYALIADGTNGLVILNTTFPNSPAYISNYNTSGSLFIDVTNANINGIQYAFISNNTGGFIILNISNPQIPVLDTVLTFSNDRVLTSFIDQQDKIAYIGTYLGYIYIYNIANLPGSVSSLSVYQNNLSNVLGLRISGTVLYAATAVTGLELVGISNPSSPIHLSYVNPPGSANSVAVNSFYAYVANGSGGIVIVDITNILNPVVKGTYSDNYNSYYGIVFNNYRLFTANGSSGVEGVSVSVPSTPTLYGFYKNPGATYNLAFDSGNIYAAAGTSGLIILKPAN